MQNNEQEALSHTVDERVGHVSEEVVPQPFYVISLNKFVVLFMGTLGLYMSYWFYKQWLCYKTAHKGDEWPMWRGAFSVFFVRSLFTKLTDLYEQKSAQKSNVLTSASVYFIVVACISFVCGNMPVSGELSNYLTLINLLTTPLFCWFCYQAQWFANYVCDDIEGNSNSEFTLANYFWLICGAGLWVIYLAYVIKPIFS